MRRINIRLIVAVFIALFLVSVSVSEASSLVGYWAFDESSGSVAYDSSSNGNNGTLINMDNSDWVTGLYGNALNFDGVNDYVSMSRSGEIETASQLVAEAWVKTTEEGVWGTIVGTGDDGWVLAKSPGNGMTAGFWLAIGKLMIVNNNAVAITDGEWHHVVTIYDSSIPQLSLYVDGTSASTTVDFQGNPVSSGSSIANNQNKAVLIGENAYATGRHWNGLIDEVKIYRNLAEYLYHQNNPNEAWDPSPTDATLSVTVDSDLSWLAGEDAVSHDVYFGTDETAVASAQRLAGDFDGDGTVDIDDLKELALQWLTSATLEDFATLAADWGQSADPEFQGNQPGTVFDPGVLTGGITYYWRVDEVSPAGTTTGRVWSFTTLSPAPTGSLVHDTEYPAWLRYAEGNYLFMCGPGDPENFLYRGTRNADGTRTGDQMTLINKLIGTGANCIYFQAVKSHGGDGDSTMNPFVDSNVNGALDEDILNQWDTWFDAMDDNGIVIFFMFYDDYANPFGGGDTMPAQEVYMVDGLVNRFKHHKSLIWIVSEEYQKALSTARVSNIAARIKLIDDYGHAVGTHQLPGTSFSFNGDTNVDQFAMQLNDATTSYIHQSCLDAWSNVGGLKNVNLAEIYEWNTIPQTGSALRQKSWAAAMGGAYSMWLWMDIASTPVSDLEICGRVVTFMQSTKFYMTQPSDSLKRGTTDYVLADPGNVYIVYSDSAGIQLGVNVQAGDYNVKWYDPIDGDWSDQGPQTVAGGDQYFIRPSIISSTEAVLYLEKIWSTYGVEAEDYDSQTGAGTWTEDTSTSGYVGSAYMADTRTDIGQATSTLTYNIDFPSAGTYYCYVRTWASDSLNNGFHLEFDTDRLSDNTDAHGTREAVYVTKQSIWNWATQWQYGEGDVEGPLVIDVSSAGTHTLGITSRDPGFRFDRIIITDYMVGGATYSTGSAPAFLDVLETIPNGYN